MAEDLDTVRTRIRGVQQLDAVIGAMRGIAAAHAQQSRALLSGVRAYAEAVVKALASALRLREPIPTAAGTRPRCARVVFGAEQGFVGGFVERVLDEVANRPPADLLLIGSRTLSVASAQNMAPVWHSAMATQVDVVATLCIRIASALYQVVADRNITMVEVVFPTWTAGKGLSVMAQSLLPLDEQGVGTVRDRVPPLSTLRTDALLVSLTEEYVYASLCEAAMQAFVAESEARASAMVRAHGKLRNMLAELHLFEHQIRQGSITAEVLELVGGHLAGVEQRD